MFLCLRTILRCTLIHINCYWKGLKSENRSWYEGQKIITKNFVSGGWVNLWMFQGTAYIVKNTIFPIIMGTSRHNLSGAEPKLRNLLFCILVILTLKGHFWHSPYPNQKALHVITLHHDNNIPTMLVQIMTCTLVQNTDHT